MSINEVRHKLTALIKEPTSAKVIVLSGLWGTGKTYLWREVREGIKDKDFNPLYLSLFGTRTVDELKLKILEAAFDKNDARYKEYLKGGFTLMTSLFGKFVPGLSLGKLAFVGMGPVLKNRLIVIDDIERKHNDLGVQEIMGFVNECSDLHQSRFLMLLNAEKLGEGGPWQEFHEKIVDRELKIFLTPGEAFDIAMGTKGLAYGDLLRKECENIKLVNIRVIQRVISLCEEVFESVEYSEIGLSGFAPVAVLATAIHYRACANLPTFSFLLKHDRTSWSDYNDLDDTEKSWAETIRKVGFMNQEFIFLIINYYENGYLDVASFSAVVGEQLRRGDRTKVTIELFALQSNWLWGKGFDVSALETICQSFLGRVEILNSNEMTQLAKIFEDAGRADLAAVLLSDWISNNEGVVAVSEDRSMFYHDHPVIEEMFERVKARLYPDINIEDAVSMIAHNGSWGHRETRSFSNATKEIFKEAFDRLDGQRLGEFIYSMHSLTRIVNIEDNYPGVMGNYYNACREIVDGQGMGRLKEILIREFERNGRIDLLRSEASLD